MNQVNEGLKHRIDRFPIWNVDTLYFQKNYSPRKLTFCIFYKKTLKVKNLNNYWCYCKFEFLHANPSHILICFKIDDWTSPVVDSFQNCGRELTLQTQNFFLMKHMINYITWFNYNLNSKKVELSNPVGIHFLLVDS